MPKIKKKRVIKKPTAVKRGPAIVNGRPLFAMVTEKEMTKLRRELHKREVSLAYWVREKIREV